MANLREEQRNVRIRFTLDLTSEWRPKQGNREPYNRCPIPGVEDKPNQRVHIQVYCSAAPKNSLQATHRSSSSGTIFYQKVGHHDSPSPLILRHSFRTPHNQLHSFTSSPQVLLCLPLSLFPSITPSRTSLGSNSDDPLMICPANLIYLVMRS